MLARIARGSSDRRELRGVTLRESATEWHGRCRTPSTGRPTGYVDFLERPAARNYLGRTDARQPGERLMRTGDRLRQATCPNDQVLVDDRMRDITSDGRTAGCATYLDLAND